MSLASSQHELPPKCNIIRRACSSGIRLVNCRPTKRKDVRSRYRTAHPCSGPAGHTAVPHRHPLFRENDLRPQVECSFRHPQTCKHRSSSAVPAVEDLNGVRRVISTQRAVPSVFCPCCRRFPCLCDASNKYTDCTPNPVVPVSDVGVELPDKQLLRGGMILPAVLKR